MNFIQCTTLSGSIAFVCYVLCRHLFHLSPGNRYKLLKLNLVFFLVPFSLLRSTFTKYMPNSFFELQEHGMLASLSPFKVIYHTDTETLQPFELYPKAWKIFYAVILLFLICILLFYLRKYLATKKLVKDAAKPITSSAILHTCQTELRIKKAVRLAELPLQCSPFTIGIFHPTIVLTKQMSNTDLYYVIKHELYHIKTADTLFQMLARLAVLLHFYNPFVYLFFHELAKVCELHCDEQVLKTADNIQRKHYGNLLIEQACCNNSKFVFSSRAFATQNKKLLRERILMCKKTIYSRKFFTIITAVSLFLLSAVPVFAYTPPIEMHILNTSELELYSNENTEIQFTEDISTLICADEKYFATTDNYFIDSAGSVLPTLEPSSQIQPRSCSHTFKYGQQKIHTRNTSGGCTVTINNVKQCTKCGYTVILSRDSQISYTKCPH